MQTTYDVHSRASIGRRIAAMRERAHLTQSELASKLGWDRSTLGGYEIGRAAISEEQLSRIAAALNCALDDLIGPDECAEKSAAYTAVRRIPLAPGDLVEQSIRRAVELAVQARGDTETWAGIEAQAKQMGATPIEWLGDMTVARLKREREKQ